MQPNDLFFVYDRRRSYPSIHAIWWQKIDNSDLDKQTHGWKILWNHYEGNNTYL